MASRIPPPKRKQVDYGMARKADPGGRLSDQDIKHQRKRRKDRRLVGNPDPH
tara:strand:- start:1298 stop:1453 length:156 start_codon:yes stop_codon:yes gene_type:complete